MTTPHESEPRQVNPDQSITGFIRAPLHASNKSLSLFRVFSKEEFRAIKNHQIVDLDIEYFELTAKLTHLVMTDYQVFQNSLGESYYSPVNFAHRFVRRYLLKQPSQI